MPVSRLVCSPRVFLRITQVTLGIIVLNIVSGGAVRLSGSGLGCSDWPTCTATRLTPPLQLHAVIEFSNRMVVVALTVLAIGAFAAAVVRTPRRRDLMWLSGGLLLGILGEAVIGAFVVYSKLNPYVVAGHFLVGIALLTDALLLVIQAGRVPGRGILRVGEVPRRVGIGVLCCLGVAIAAGTATTGAGPHAGGPGAKRIPVAFSDMARTHSLVVMATGILVLAFLAALHREQAPPGVQHRAQLLLGTMVLQGVIGYTQYFTHVPPLLVGVHILGVTVVWSAALWCFAGLTHHEHEPLLSGVPAGRFEPAGSPA
jgi:cytochrome c oxidase assembly protein subunit 15